MITIVWKLRLPFHFDLPNSNTQLTADRERFSRNPKASNARRHPRSSCYPRQFRKFKRNAAAKAVQRRRRRRRRRRIKKKKNWRSSRRGSNTGESSSARVYRSAHVAVESHLDGDRRCALLEVVPASDCFIFKVYFRRLRIYCLIAASSRTRARGQELGGHAGCRHHFRWLPRWRKLPVRAVSPKLRSPQPCLLTRLVLILAHRAGYGCVCVCVCVCVCGYVGACGCVCTYINFFTRGSSCTSVLLVVLALEFYFSARKRDMAERDIKPYIFTEVCLLRPRLYRPGFPRTLHLLCQTFFVTGNDCLFTRFLLWIEKSDFFRREPFEFSCYIMQLRKQEWGCVTYWKC